VGGNELKGLMWRGDGRLEACMLAVIREEEGKVARGIARLEGEAKAV